MKAFRPLFARLLVGASVLVSGCTANLKAPFSLAAIGTRLSGVDSQEICRRISAVTDEIESLRLLFEVEARRFEEGSQFRLALVETHWDHVRVDSLPMQSSYTLGIVVSTPREAFALDVQKKEYVRSSSDRAVVERVWPGFSVSRAELLAILTGRMQSGTCRNSIVLLGKEEGEGYLLSELSSESLWEVGTDLTIRRAVIKGDRSPAFPLYVTLDRENASDPFPSSIRITSPSTNVTVTLLVRRVKINEPVREETFQPVIPSDYRPVLLGGER
jgi:hypothetical protein